MSSKIEAGAGQPAPDSQMQNIAMINDTFRKKVLHAPQPDGKAVITRGVAALPSNLQAWLFHAVATDTDFPAGNDPYGEHDFGVVVSGDMQFYWKIDYYADAGMEFGTADKANAYRVLVIMLAEEY